MKVILSGGGTGGHIYPALAIAQEIRERRPEATILYVGAKGGMEKAIVPKAGFDFESIDISGINRSSLLKAAGSLSKLPRGFFQGWTVARDFKPDVTIGTGGYVSFPVVLAASFLGGKTYIHEQNAFPGLANRSLARRVDCVMLTFPEAARYLKAKSVRVTGLPVRKDMIGADPREAKRELGLMKGKFTLLVFGGSRGAHSINLAMLDAMERLGRKDMQVIWLTGESDYQEIRTALAARVSIDSSPCKLRLLPYMDNINLALAAADLALCRAGAGTLCELAIVGLPAILVPYPYAAENHQEMNARALLKKNAAAMVIDEFLDGDTIYQKVTELMSDQAGLREMSGNIRREARPSALKDITDIVLS